MRLGRRALAAAVLLCLAAEGMASAERATLTAQGSEQGQPFVDRTEVSFVLVPVTVLDARGRPVATLERHRFRLLVDGLDVPIRSFWREGGLPLSLTILLDTSGSMGTRRLGRAREAVGSFVSQLAPHDEVCLITFGAGEVKRRLRFGEDPARLADVLGPLKGFGTTALYDVLSAAPQLLQGARHVRRAVLLFTDGVDTASEVSPEEARQILLGIEEPLYVFGIEPPPDVAGRKDTYDVLLASFAAATGGRYMRVEDVSRLPALARDLRRELTMRYIIAFEPSGIGERKERRLEVRVDGKYQVRARRSYVGTLP
ncbi:MAG: VWA domain-containing protein [Acidobacteriota bacterium]